MRKGDTTKFTKDFWQTVVAYGGNDPEVVRNYDIKKGHKEGLSFQQLANKFGLSKRQIIRICNK